MSLFLYLTFLLGLCSALGNHLPFFEFFAHIQPWVLMIITLSCALALIQKRRIVCVLLLLVCLYHIAFTAPYLSFDFLGTKQIPESQTLRTFRILQFNINADNSRHDDLAVAVERAEPDLMVICEANLHILDRLSHLHSVYPYRIEVGRWPNASLLDASGTVLWSKFPFVESEPLVLEKGKIQICHATLSLGDAFPAISIYAAHLLAPRTKQQIMDRNNGLMELTQLLKADKHPTAMLIGDLNQSVWTPGTRNLMKQAHLSSVLKGRMFLSTWPDSTYPFGVAIDHILFRGNLSCVGTGTLDGMGSDHRMLVAEMSLAPNHRQ